LRFVFVTAQVIRKMKGVLVDGCALRTNEHNSFAMYSIDMTNHIGTSIERFKTMLANEILRITQK
uniref:Chloramphenicol acetyltransferase n=1 Tax=Haemonchus placei TaxID=6290 RepID=A0A0N4XAD5_HAEPC